MSKRKILSAIACMVFLKGLAFSQGLSAIQNFSADFSAEEPWLWSAGVSVGYDSLEYDQVTPGIEGFDSSYLNAFVGVARTKVDPTTPWKLSADIGAIHYLSDLAQFDSNFYNSRVAFNISHQLSARLKISNNLFVTYASQPNLAQGATTTAFGGQYLYGFNNFNVSYAWSQRFSTTTSVTVDGIAYEDELISQAEDRLSQLVAQQFSYSLTRRASLTAEYRFRNTTYTNAVDRDFQSHFVLGGMDYAWSERFAGSFRAGAEFYDSERASNVAPYAEVALNYAVARKTRAQWFGSLGFDGAELANYESRYALRTGANLSHQITKKLAVNTGLQYSFSDFDGGGVIADVVEHSVLFSAGVSYQVLENLSVDASYNYSILQSDNSSREFTRNNVSLGLTASF